MAYDDIANSR
jgi:legumain